MKKKDLVICQNYLLRHKISLARVRLEKIVKRPRLVVFEDLISGVIIYGRQKSYHEYLVTELSTGRKIRLTTPARLLPNNKEVVDA